MLQSNNTTSFDQAAGSSKHKATTAFGELIVTGGRVELKQVAVAVILEAYVESHTLVPSDGEVVRRAAIERISRCHYPPVTLNSHPKGSVFAAREVRQKLTG